jgi:hypothetical protein
MTAATILFEIFSAYEGAKLRSASRSERVFALPEQPLSSNSSMEITCSMSLGGQCPRTSTVLFKHSFLTRKESKVNALVHLVWLADPTTGLRSTTHPFLRLDWINVAKSRHHPVGNGGVACLVVPGWSHYCCEGICLCKRISR